MANEKFYKGSQSDTPWNKDLLWRYHVSKEDKQEQVNAGERQPSDMAIKRRQERMVMGMTGTLIPDITPRQNHNRSSSNSSDHRSLMASASGRRLMQPTHHDAVPHQQLLGGSHDIVRSVAASSRSGGARSHKAASVSSRLSSSSSTSSLSSSSSTRSTLRLQDVQEILDSQSRQLRASTDDELRVMRVALQDEARKREDAERKIQFLCEKLGITE